MSSRSKPPAGHGRPGPAGRTPPGALNGRGTARNAPSRYLAVTTEPVDDGWGLDTAEGCEPRAINTRASPDRTVTLITRNTSPDIPFDRSINPYKGCEHGCVYCFARPTHAYLDLSPGLDFETRLFYKTNAAEHLMSELSKPGYTPSPIAMGTNTDPYQPLERRLGVTRQILEVLLAMRHPVTLVTKSSLILRDMALLESLAERQLVSVHVSITTLDNGLKSRLEPRTAAPGARLNVVRELSRHGVPVGVMAAPMIPFINDAELEDIVAASAAAGAAHAGYILLRLPLEVRELFEDWLDVHYPLKKDRVMAAIRASRGGKAYDSAWGKRMRGEGVFADLLARRFELAVQRSGLIPNELPDLRLDHFESPAQNQLSLF